MNDQAAHNDQPGHIIERSGDALPVYFSEKIGRDFGSPNGGWTGERDQATAYTEEQAHALLVGALQHVAPNCKVVTK